MFEKVLEEGDFYVICPDNETTPVSAAQCSKVAKGTTARGPQLIHRLSTRLAFSGLSEMSLRTARRFRAGIRHTLPATRISSRAGRDSLLAVAVVAALPWTACPTSPASVSNTVSSSIAVG